MAFTLAAYLDSASVTLNSAPYAVVDARGMGGVDTRRVTSQGPAQHGDTDLGYRLTPRNLVLVIGIEAATDALLDGYRDDLLAIFKPLTSTPINLRVTRDDGGIRQLDCYVRGKIDVSLVPSQRPGHYCRVTIPLQAADPAWYGLAPGTATTLGTVAFLDNWWLAGGAIDASQVLMHGTAPALDEAWSYTGTITASESWELAVRAAYVAPSGTLAYMFAPADAAANAPRFYKNPTLTSYWYYGPSALATLGMIAGTQNYFNYNAAGRQYWSSPAQASSTTPAGSVNGAQMRWRTLGWSGSIQLYALYSPYLDGSQRNALRAYMSGTAGTASTTVVIPYAGDLPEYPIISLTGPISSPSITNTSTGDTLSFGTISIGAGTTYVIDTRPNYKTVKVGTVDHKYELTSDSDLGTWHLAPAPVVTGGTNIITVGGTAPGTAIQISVVYYDRYSSF